MTITEIQITPIKPQNGLVALASVVFDNSLYLGSIGVYARLDGSGYRITYPTKKLNGRDFNVYHPINRTTALTIEQAVLEKAEKVLIYQDKRCNEHVGHGNTDNPEEVV